MTIEPSPYSNRSFTRWWTLRQLNQARAELGDEHADTVAAHALAVEAWGEGRLPRLHAPSSDVADLMRRVGARTVEETK